MVPMLFRKILRYSHIVFAVLLAGLIYSPTLRATDAYVAVMQFAAFPVIALTGLAMWQQAWFMRLFRRR